MHEASHPTRVRAGRPMITCSRASHDRIVLHGEVGTGRMYDDTRPAGMQSRQFGG